MLIFLQLLRTAFRLLCVFPLPGPCVGLRQGFEHFYIVGVRFGDAFELLHRIGKIPLCDLCLGRSNLCLDAFGLYQKRRLKLPDLYESPFTAFGTDAVERLFTPAQIHDILDFTDTLAA